MQREIRVLVTVIGKVTDNDTPVCVGRTGLDLRAGTMEEYVLLSAVLHVAVAHTHDSVFFRRKVHADGLYASGVDSVTLVASGGKFTPVRFQWRLYNT